MCSTGRKACGVFAFSILRNKQKVVRLKKVLINLQHSPLAKDALGTLLGSMFGITISKFENENLLFIR